MVVSVSASAVDAAIDWYVRLAAADISAAERGAFAQWLDADAGHAEAWRRVQGLGGTFARSLERIPAPLSRRVLEAAGHADCRRRALKALLLAGTGGGSLWLLRESLVLPRRWDGRVADLSTAVGQRRRLRLVDGSILQLNTASALDIDFDAQWRRLLLRRGEIEVVTAADPAGRPFLVETVDARLMPVGTRFGVRRFEPNGTLLTVREGAVVAQPLSSDKPLQVRAGWQLRLDRQHPGQPEPLDAAAVAWTEGLISVQRMRLGDFVAELDRYQPGWLRCDPAVAGLRLTAVHKLDGPQSIAPILDALQRSLPVSVRRLSRYWVTVGPRHR